MNQLLQLQHAQPKFPVIGVGTRRHFTAIFAGRPVVRVVMVPALRPAPVCSQTAIQ